jgi:hypothetical protein
MMINKIHSTSIHNLPTETVVHIFSYLNIENLVTVHRCCREWKKISEDKSLFQRLWPPQLHYPNAFHDSPIQHSIANHFMHHIMRRGHYQLKTMKLPHQMTPTYLISKFNRVFVASQLGYLTIYEAENMNPLVCRPVTEKGHPICCLEAISENVCYVGFLKEGQSNNIDLHIQEWHVKGDFLFKQSLTIIQNLSSQIKNTLNFYSHSLHIHPSYPSYLFVKTGSINAQCFLLHQGTLVKEMNGVSACTYNEFLFIIKKEIEHDQLEIFDLSKPPDGCLVSSKNLPFLKQVKHLHHMDVTERFLNIYGDRACYQLDYQDCHRFDLNVIKPTHQTNYQNPTNIQGLKTYFNIPYFFQNNQLKTLNRKTGELIPLSSNRDFKKILPTHSTLIEFADQKIFLVIDFLSSCFLYYEVHSSQKNAKVRIIKKILRERVLLIRYLASHIKPLMQVIKTLSPLVLSILMSYYWPVTLVTFPPASVMTYLWFKQHSSDFKKITNLVSATLSFLFIPLFSHCQTFQIRSNRAIEDYQFWRYQQLYTSMDNRIQSFVLASQNTLQIHNQSDSIPQNSLKSE